MSNISKMVRDMMLNSKEVRYETTSGLSVGTVMAPWMTMNRPSSRSLKLHVKYFENGV